MSNKRALWLPIASFVILAMTLSACQGAQPEPTEVPTEVPAPTEAMEEEPTDEPEMAAVEPDPGITDDSIKLGVWTPLSGFLASVGLPVADGLRAWAAEVNAAGGVDGRMIDLIVYDDAGSPDEAGTAVRRLVEQDQVFALVCGSTTGATLPVLDYIGESGVPFVACITSHRTLTDPFRENVFGHLYAQELNQASEVARYFVEAAGSERPAAIYSSSDFTIGGFESTSAALSDEYGVEFIESQRYNIGEQDFSAPLLRIIDADPDLLWVHAFPAEAGNIVRQARELGLEVPIVGGGAVPTPLFPEAAGEAAVGVVANWVFPTRPEDTTGPMAHLRELQLQYLFDEYATGRPSLYDITGYMAGTVVEEALSSCSPDNLTRDCFMSALESLEGFEQGGGLGFPVTYGPEDHTGTTEVSWVIVNEDLEWVIFDPYE